ncbi:glutamate--cysteine ligase, partial [Klebsiella pneumoniae]
KVGKDLFRDLKRVAQTLDSIHGGEEYQKVCDELVACFDNPELTFSARILRSMIDEGIGGTGKAFGEAYRNLLREEPLEILQEEEFIAERDASVRRQQ